MAKSLLIRTAPPAVVAVDREEVWEHLRTIAESEVDSPSSDAPEDAAYLDGLIAAAVDRLDGPHGLLNRALVTQSWKAIYPRFPAEILIPLARCQSVDSITYLDSAGDEQTLATAAYRVTGLLTDSCRIRPINGTSWPATYSDAEAVVVTFTSGFGDAADDVPASIRHALLEMVATAYNFRESVIAGAGIASLPAAASRVVADWISWPVDG